jgi:hypothetical protein
MCRLAFSHLSHPFCRKVRFWGQNPKIGYQKFNDLLQTAKLSKKQLCDRTPWASCGGTAPCATYPPDIVGQPPSAEICVSHMPSLKAKKLGKLPREKVLLEL